VSYKRRAPERNISSFGLHLIDLREQAAIAVIGGGDGAVTGSSRDVGRVDAHGGKECERQFFRSCRRDARNFAARMTRRQAWVRHRPLCGRSVLHTSRTGAEHDRSVIDLTCMVEGFDNSKLRSETRSTARILEVTPWSFGHLPPAHTAHRATVDQAGASLRWPAHVLISTNHFVALNALSGGSTLAVDLDFRWR
jgi:hypothetical protein